MGPGQRLGMPRSSKPAKNRGEREARVNKYGLSLWFIGARVPWSLADCIYNWTTHFLCQTTARCGGAIGKVLVIGVDTGTGWI